MVQAKGDQGALGDAVDPGTDVAGTQDQVADQGDALLDHRPDVEHGDTDHNVDGGGDDGNEASAAEEAQDGGQLDLVELVVQHSHAQAHDDATEDTHLQRGDTQRRGGGVGRHGFHAAAGGNHGADGGVHDQVADGTGKRGNLLLLLGHADGNAHSEQQGQVGENRVAALVHDIQNGVDQAAGIDDAGQTVSLQHGGVGEGAADTQQQAGHGQQRDGQHKGPAHALENAKDFVFHLLYLRMLYIVDYI